MLRPGRRFLGSAARALRRTTSSSSPGRRSFPGSISEVTGPLSPPKPPKKELCVRQRMGTSAFNHPCLKKAHLVHNIAATFPCFPLLEGREEKLGRLFYMPT